MITTNVKSFEEMTLKEINNLHNIYLAKRYDSELQKYKIDKVAREVVNSLYGESLNDILYAIEQSRLEYKSEEFFPGSAIIVYPGIKEVRAKRNYICDFSGARISEGNLYINYRPMLKNISNGNTYVLKRTIKTEITYEYDLPTNIAELEELNDRIINYEYQDNTDIQYDHLFSQTGGGLHFKKLNRRKGYENRNNKWS